jgi:hypothetical protein
MAHMIFVMILNTQFYGQWNGTEMIFIFTKLSVCYKNKMLGLHRIYCKPNFYRTNFVFFSVLVFYSSAARAA